MGENQSPLISIAHQSEYPGTYMYHEIYTSHEFELVPWRKFDICYFWPTLQICKQFRTLWKIFDIVDIFRTPSINAQCRSKSWHWSEMPLNASQYRLIPINSSQCRIKATCRSMLDQFCLIWHWSELIGIDRHWDQCQNSDRHWSASGINRGSPAYLEGWPEYLYWPCLYFSHFLMESVA